MNSTVVIIDAFGIGRYFAPILKQLGFACVHMQSTKTIPASYRSTFHASDFVETIIYQGDLAQTVAQLKRYQIAFFCREMNRQLP